MNSTTINQTSKDLICRVAFTLIKQGVQCVPKKIGAKCPAILQWQKKIKPEQQFTNFEIVNNYDGFLIVTGNNSELTVLDFDSKELAENFIKQFRVLQKLPIVKTRHGYHVYLPYLQELKSTANGELHLDIRNDGACVVAPPSPLVYKEGEENAGGEYKFINFNIEKDLHRFKEFINTIAEQHKEEIREVVEFYEFLNEIKSSITMAAGIFNLAPGDFLPIHKNNRNSYLVKLFGYLANKNKTYNEQHIKMFCKVATVPMLDDSEVENQYRSYCTYHENHLKENGGKLSKNKDNNASESTSFKNYIHSPELINRLIEADIYYSEKLGRWIKLKDTNNFNKCVSTDGEEGVIVSEFCDEYKITTAVEVILERLKHNKELILRKDVEMIYEIRDNHFYMLFKDCIYDLVTDAVLDLDAKVSIDIVINDTSEHFLFKREVISNSVNNLLFEHVFGPIKLDFLKMVAHNLDLKSPFQYFVIIVGDQRTGKSTILKILMEHLGKHRCAYIDKEEDLQHEYYKAGLKNKNFCIIDDVDLSKISPTIFKKMIKGAKISGRALYQNPETFEFTSALIIANNYVPTFVNTQGLERRCLIFNTREELTKELEQHLLKGEHLTDAEREEFILMLVKAKQMLKKDVDFIENLSDEYKKQLASALNEVFILQKFVNDNYEFGPNSSEKINDVYTKFKQFMEEQESDNPVLHFPSRNVFRRDLATVKIGGKKLKIVKKYGMYYVENLIEKEKLISKRALTGEDEENIKVVDDSVLMTEVEESPKIEEDNVEKTLERMAKHNDNSEKLQRIRQEEEEEFKLLSTKQLTNDEDNVEETSVSLDSTAKAPVNFLIDE